MRKIDKKSTPLALLAGIKKALDELNNLVQQNGSIIRKEDSESFYFLAKDIDQTSKFFFHLEEVILSKNETQYNYAYAPRNDFNIEGATFSGNLKTLLGAFQNWIARINTYNSFELLEEDKFKNEYQKEFEEYFEIADDDAEVKPFDEERQIFIYRYLEIIINRLELINPQEHKEIIEDAKKLKENLQNLTKKETIKWLAKIWATIRKRGVKLLLDFYDVAKKEAMKKILYGGLNEIGPLMDKVF